MDGLFDNSVLSEFDAHAVRMREASRSRREAVALRNLVDDPADEEAADVRATFGVQQPGERLKGDTAIRTLHQLLHLIDENGFERSAHQVQCARHPARATLRAPHCARHPALATRRFHDSMIRAVARVLYRADWATKKPDIMRKHGWQRAPSEVLVSTPRRFGKVTPHPPTTLKKFRLRGSNP